MSASCAASADAQGSDRPADSKFPIAYVSPADGDIWVNLSSRAAPLRVSNDQRQKSTPKISPDGRRFVYDGRCCRAAGDEAAIGKWDEVVVAEWPNHILWRTVDLLPAPKPGPQSRCGAIDTLDWIDNDRLAVSCMASPSALDYAVLSISQRRPVAQFRGLDFVWSPNKGHVAHLGNIIHFAGPEFQSNCLMIDNLQALRPKCDGGGHGKRSAPDIDPNIESIANITWSPDSRHVAFFDGMADWKAHDNPHDVEARDGEFVNERSYVAVTSPGGFAAGWEITCEEAATLRWLDANRLKLTCGKKTRIFDLSADHPGALP